VVGQERSLAICQLSVLLGIDNVGVVQSQLLHRHKHQVRTHTEHVIADEQACHAAKRHCSLTHSSAANVDHTQPNSVRGQNGAEAVEYAGYSQLAAQHSQRRTPVDAALGMSSRTV